MSFETESIHVRRPMAAVQKEWGIVVLRGEDGRPGRAVEVVDALTVGRGEAADLRLADSGLSRKHARLVRDDDGGFRVSDLESRNGTYVNGEKVRGHYRIAGNASWIRVGHSILWVTNDIAQFVNAPYSQSSAFAGGPSMTDLLRKISIFASSDCPILITGSTGTGKELVAREIHEASGRRGEPVMVNCAALPETLIESELFGHSAGSFSDAAAARPGLFRSADGGTIVLDEIGEMPLTAQAKLLRVLEGGEVRPVGCDRPVVVDVRVVASTHRDLEALVASGEFRQDLYQRLSGVVLTIPDLEERREDIPALISTFLQDVDMRASVEFVEELLNRGFSGNVRELKRLVLVSATRARADSAEEILVRHLPEDTALPELSIAPAIRAEIEVALTVREGNLAQVALDLGLEQKELVRRIQQLGIET